MQVKPTTLLVGEKAEKKAWEFLKAQGCRLAIKNSRSRMGEIDLVVLDHEVLVFVEVRYRSDSSRGTGAESITRAKIRKIVLTAQHFLSTHPRFTDTPCRFDVVSMDDEISWYREAFTLDT